MSFWYDLVLSQNHAELKWHETAIYRLPDPSTGSIARLSSCNSIWQYCDIQSIFQNKQRDRSLLMNERVHLLLPTRSGWFFNSYAGLYGTSEIRTPVLRSEERRVGNEGRSVRRAESGRARGRERRRSARGQT